MKKSAIKPSIIDSSLSSAPNEIDVYTNVHCDVVIRLDEEYITIRPHHAAQLSKMLKKCAVLASEKIRTECYK